MFGTQMCQKNCVPFSEKFASAVLQGLGASLVGIFDGKPTKCPWKTSLDGGALAGLRMTRDLRDRPRCFGPGGFFGTFVSTTNLEFWSREVFSCGALSGELLE